jgi:hypothetical protein
MHKNVKEWYVQYYGGRNWGRGRSGKRFCEMAHKKLKHLRRRIKKGSKMLLPCSPWIFFLHIFPDFHLIFCHLLGSAAWGGHNKTVILIGCWSCHPFLCCKQYTAFSTVDFSSTWYFWNILWAPSCFSTLYNMVLSADYL